MQCTQKNTGSVRRLLRRDLAYIQKLSCVFRNRTTAGSLKHNFSTKFLSVFDVLLTMHVREAGHVHDKASGGISWRSFRSKKNTTSSFSQLQTCPELALMTTLTLKAELAELTRMQAWCREIFGPPDCSTSQFMFFLSSQQGISASLLHDVTFPRS